MTYKLMFAHIVWLYSITNMVALILVVIWITCVARCSCSGGSEEGTGRLTGTLLPCPPHIPGNLKQSLAQASQLSGVCNEQQSLLNSLAYLTDATSRNLHYSMRCKKYIYIKKPVIRCMLYTLI